VWNFEDPKKLYDHLCNLCIGDQHTAREVPRNEIESIQFASIRVLIQEFRLKYNHLQNLTTTITDHEFARMFLWQVASTYMEFKATCERRTSKTTTGLHNLEEILKDIETTAVVMGDGSEEKIKSALISSHLLKKPGCSFCGKKNHTIDKCYKKLNLCLRCGSPSDQVKDCES
jgi:hypothetical protein